MIKGYSKALGSLLLLFLVVAFASCQTGRPRPEFMPAEVFPEPETGYYVEGAGWPGLPGLNQDQAFIPASLTKVITATFALRVLGEDFRYKTYVRSTGSSRDGVLRGNLYLQGAGDPFLTAAHLMGLAQALRRKGIHEVQGHFYFDDSLFLGQDSIDAAMDPTFAYNPGISALSSEFNQASLRWNFGKDWVGPNLYLLPGLSLFSAEKLGLVMPKEIQYSEQGGHETWSLSSDTRVLGNARVPVKHPGRYTALLFSEFCRLSGITLPEPTSARAPTKSARLLVHTSEPLLQTAERMLEYSNNMTAELLSLTAARKVVGHAVSVSEAADIMREWLAARIKREEFKNIKLANSSGLTTGNLVTPHQIVELLEYAESEPFGERSFSSLLPISGWKGTLTERMATPDAAFHVWAKTGSLDFVSALGGYVFTRAGHKLTFAILMKDEKLAQSSKALPPAEATALASRWNQMAHLAQEKYLRQWIDQL